MPDANPDPTVRDMPIVHHLSHLHDWHGLDLLVITVPMAIRLHTRLHGDDVSTAYDGHRHVAP